MTDATGGDTAKRLEAAVAELREALGKTLLSVILYGSAARGDWSKEGSDLNLLVVLEDDSLAVLEKAAGINTRWVDRGNPPFLFFSPWWIEHSRDVFPLEFMDILDARRVLQGTEPFTGLAVSLADLRLQCERELKTRLIQLRTGYLALSARPDRLAQLLAASYSPLAALCRGVLRVAGETPPPHAPDAVERVAALYGLDPAPLKEVEALKRSGPRGAAVAPRSLFQSYYLQVETLARALDAGLPGGLKR